MINLVEKLCLLNGASGNEDAVRNFILSEIKDYCKAEVDVNGNIIAFKKGKKPAKNKVMLDAHMDEVGFIITSVTDNGMLRFATVGGIEVPTLMGSRVTVNNRVGVIGVKPIHLCEDEEKSRLPKVDDLLIDIGAENAEDALKYVSIGDIGTFEKKFVNLGNDLYKANAIDDRIGCAAVIKLLKEESEFDFYATFTVGEELGLRGAATAAYTVSPDFAVVFEATTAADIQGTPKGKEVCFAGKGAAVSFMDNSTLYNHNLFEKTLDIAKKNNITVQTKTYVSGGNNAGAIHLSKGGVKTITLSLPCRYIHSPSSLASKTDTESVLNLGRELLKYLSSKDKND